ncbi:hypothetical protein DFH07DRAFT_1018327 [Mycena maculata]|uniref:Uncharacterized protein n=1 Tax=Mycena maculata TaxID=230809 RepID=A0AAD7NK10_9AGAR|nr:hypothetical protein DFH07DRAFT_1018327 [Mycena maculata]
MGRHMHQPKFLEIQYEDEDDDGDGFDDEDDDDPETIDLVGDKLLSLPCLETLRVYGVLHPRRRRRFSGPQIMELLRRSPNLVECMLEHLVPMFRSDPSEMLILPGLRRLLFGRDPNSKSDESVLLKCLSLPRLETLSISMNCISCDDLLSFLKRSSCPLQQLFVVGSRYWAMAQIQIRDCLRLVPTLVDVEMWWPSLSLFEGLFAALTEPLSYSLPNLRSLVIHIHSTIPKSFWSTLLRTLSARRAQIQIVQVKGNFKPRPPATVVAPPRENWQRMGCKYTLEPTLQILSSLSVWHCVLLCQCQCEGQLGDSSASSWGMGLTLCPQ